MNEIESSLAGVRADKVVQVTLNGFFINLVLTVLKYLAGIFGHSGAMLADATHSLSDILTDIAILIGFLFIRKPADKTHRYGHGKIETLVSSFCGIALILAAIGILMPALSKLYQAWNGVYPQSPGWIAFAAAIASVILKEWLYRYTKKRGEQLNSPALEANAWHHRSDAFSSIGTGIGIGGAVLGGARWVILDPIAAVIVSALVLKVGVDILLGSLNELIECSIGEEEEAYIQNLFAEDTHILGYHALQSRKIGYYVAIEAHIFVNRQMNIVEAHDIATHLENTIRAHFGDETHVSLHVEPAPLKGTIHREDALEGAPITPSS